MAINNSNRPVNAGARQVATREISREINTGVTVGNNYAERSKFLSSHRPEAKINQTKDFFSATKEVPSTKAAEFEANAKFILGRFASPHKAVEKGTTHGRKNISDSTRLEFLDSIIGVSGAKVAKSAENLPPPSAKARLKSAI